MQFAVPRASERVPLPVCSHQPAPYGEATREEILALRRQYCNPGLLLYYDEPLCVVEGHMQYLWDERGRRYLDAAGGIVTVSVGHCHPKVTSAVQKQVGRLCHTTTLYLHPGLTAYARELARHMPPGTGLSQTYFGNSGSEANEYAILMARVYTGRHEVLALRNGYHGGTGATMRISGVGDWKFAADAGVPVHHGTPGYCYRCPNGLTYPACDLRCARAFDDMIRYETAREVACFIAEPVQGVGGVITPPREFFQVVYEIVRRHGGLCISDEVQTAWGRLGESFWGFEYYGVTPDIVTMAKGIANGAPLSAVTARPEIAAALARRMHFNTFGGNPVSIAAARATLAVLDEEQVQIHSRKIGALLREKLLELQEKHELIGDVRGLGLLQAIELVTNRQSREPATAATKRVVELARERHLLVGKAGARWNVIRLAPPMCISRDDVAFLADCLDRCLTDAEKESR